jgi:murein DD-endopeptidase MepM/ murein hydrolase activator NlpD
MIETRKKANFLFLYSDGRYYNQKGKAIEGFLMRRPVVFTRISSSFTLKRWHPILKRYRAHLGIDYAAKRGTPVKAAANGKIIYRARKGGYGKTVQIKHEGGYKTLYAHLNNYNKFARLGKRVRKGQVIGYVGNTGMSTGPHLHFGVYKNNRAINPAKVIKITRTQLYGKKKKEFFKSIIKYKNLIHTAMSNKRKPHKIQYFTEKTCFLYFASISQQIKKI